MARIGKGYKEYYEKNKDKTNISYKQFIVRINSWKYNTLEEALTDNKKKRTGSLKEYYYKNKNKATVGLIQFYRRVQSWKYKTLKEALTSPKTKGRKRNIEKNESKSKEVILILDLITNSFLKAYKKRQKRKKILKYISFWIWILGSIYLLKRKK